MTEKPVRLPTCDWLTLFDIHQSPQTIVNFHKVDLNTVFGTTVQYTMSSLREHIHTIIKDRLHEHLSDSQQIDLERGIYNMSLQTANEKGVRKHWENPDFAEIYKMHARRVVSNLDPTSYVKNVRLLERLKEGEFQPHDIAFMGQTELFPEHWQAFLDDQLKKETTMLEGDTSAGSNMFKCKRCGKSKTRYYEQQTRSADEPMTIFIQCLNCGKEWRQ